MPEPLDYALPANDWPRRRRVAVAVVALVVVGVGLVALLPTITFRRIHGRTDAVTGSMECRTEWPLGVMSAPVVTPSPLETRMVRMGILWQRDWRVIHRTGYSVLGHFTGGSCGRAPPIYTLNNLQSPFVAASSDGDVRGFVRTMQDGTEAEQRAAVDAAADPALDSLSAGSPSAARPGE